MSGIAGPTQEVASFFPGWFSPVTGKETTNDGEVKEDTEQKRQIKRVLVLCGNLLPYHYLFPIKMETFKVSNWLFSSLGPISNKNCLINITQYLTLSLQRLVLTHTLDSTSAASNSSFPNAVFATLARTIISDGRAIGESNK